MKSALQEFDLHFKHWRHLVVITEIWIQVADPQLFFIIYVLMHLIVLCGSVVHNSHEDVKKCL